MRGSSPLRDCGNIVAESCIIQFVNEDAEESSRFFVRVRLVLGLDIDDESRGYGRKQAGL